MSPALFSAWLVCRTLPAALASALAPFAVDEHVQTPIVRDQEVVDRGAAVYDVLVAVPGRDRVAARAGIYVVLARAADQRVVAGVAVDGVRTVTALYPVAALVAVEGVVAAVALYKVAPTHRLSCTEALDEVVVVGAFEGIRVLGAGAMGVTGLGDPLASLVPERPGERHPGGQG